MNNLKNDEKFVLLDVKDEPTISFRIWFKAGSQNDPPGKEGLAMFTAMMLTDGATAVNSYEQILEKLYPIASSYSASVDKEMTIIYGRTHKDNLEEYYKLFTDAILKPAFKQEDFDRIKMQILNYLENELRYSSDEELGKAALYEYIFEGTNYRHLTGGTINGINSITLDDIRDFYSNNYSRHNYVIGLGGGFNVELAKRINTDLSNLPDINVVPQAAPKTEQFEGLNIWLIDKECDATAISFGFPIQVLRGDDDYFSLFLFNSWFGEHRNQSSHLYQVIREKRGMNYGNYSYIEHFANGGSRQFPAPNFARKQQIFEVWLRPVQHVHRHFALRAAIRELQKIVENGLTPEQFELTKNFLYNYSLFFAQTISDRLGYQIDSRFYGIKDNNNYIDFFRTKINNLKLDDVNNAIKKHIQFSNLKIAIVTSGAEEFKTQLVNNDLSPVSYPIKPDSTILNEDKLIESYELEITPDKVQISKVEKLFQK